MQDLAVSRVEQILKAAPKARILVVGDVMLDHFIWGHVARISPEAPVPVVEFERESHMPGGAANVARNLAALGARPQLFGIIGRDKSGAELKELLGAQGVSCEGLFEDASRPTSVKTRIIAHQQQVVRVDREDRRPLAEKLSRKLLTAIEGKLKNVDALILGDYGKGVVSQEMLDELKSLCRSRGIWLSMDPKPVHQLNLSGLSLITPNRKEAFELGGMHDGLRGQTPLQDERLLKLVEKLLRDLKPALLLVTLGDQGMLLCKRGEKPFHIPTMAQEVYDVSGAGDTVIASFTLAVSAGASPVEAAIVSNHAAGVVVGKVGTATATPQELLASFKRDK
ncbi:MAG TPA: D-glycero-beta-D-manno-heptose-7-phosphate kinase [Methylomirabilota bacterium]|nr:D-glycero-beta-D-manno-heptose-7-phosphate kinase [Methylomirabilota bacterium]